MPAEIPSRHKRLASELSVRKKKRDRKFVDGRCLPIEVPAFIAATLLHICCVFILSTSRITVLHPPVAIYFFANLFMLQLVRVYALAGA